MSTTTAEDGTDLSAGDAPIEVIRELQPELERLAETELPIAPHAKNALDRLEEAEADA
ncbi:hypothetical protein ABNG02_15900 [Halorubrum ejinorense]|uniref:Uncharacterized protein n=1 Tax=Halorubrum ejinorense TaxID=425309 RepID=A0AAV3SQY9_9EURY